MTRFLSYALAFALLARTANALWPMPRALETGSTPLTLADDIAIHVAVPSPPQDLLDAVSRTASFLKDDKLQRLVIGRGASDAPALHAAKQLASLTLSLQPGAPRARSIATEAQAAITARDESYVLSVPADGSASVLTANTTLGLLRGLTTFSQLWYEFDGVTYTLEAPMNIRDAPAYPYRGLMLDTARNFFPVSDIERTLDAMSWVKINTLHWHVVDSQSFPLEVAEFPELSQAGAYSQTDVYTQSDVQGLIDYAGARGIDIVVEIDTPGHTAVIAQSHPEYVACNQATPWSTFANEPPAGQLRLASAATTNFTAHLIGAVAARFPSPLFSTGGDELNTECYAQDAPTQADLAASGRTLEQALNVFTQATHGTLLSAGKTPVVWEEMVLDHNVTLSNETVVMVWISSLNAAAVAAKNFRIVHSPSDFFYLDCGAGEWLGDDIPGNSWCDPFKTWQKSYSFDPLANLTDAQTELVLGGQNLLWTEQSSPSNLDPITWPRAATSAEVFWTGATLPDGNPRNVSEALPRLHDVRYRMVQRGVSAIPLQPEWCAIRPGVCDLDA